MLTVIGFDHSYHAELAKRMEVEYKRWSRVHGTNDETATTFDFFVV